MKKEESDGEERSVQAQTENLHNFRYRPFTEPWLGFVYYVSQLVYCRKKLSDTTLRFPRNPVLSSTMSYGGAFSNLLCRGTALDAETLSLRFRIL